MLIRAAALLFDMDGTLVDSSAAVERAWTNWSLEHGLDPGSVLAVAHGRQAIDTMRLVAPKLATSTNANAFLQREIDDLEGVVEVPGASRLLRSLPPHSWAVVTSAQRELARVRLCAADLPGPQFLITAEDVGRGKPHPESYQLAAKLLKASAEQCVAFEDAAAGISSASAAGAMVIRIAAPQSPLDGRCARTIPDFLTVKAVIMRDLLCISIEEG